MLERGTEVYIKSKPTLGVFLIESFSLVMQKAGSGDFSLLAKILPQNDVVIGERIVSANSAVFVDASKLAIHCD